MRVHSAEMEAEFAEYTRRVQDNEIEGMPVDVDRLAAIIYLLISFGGRPRIAPNTESRGFCLRKRVMLHSSTLSQQDCRSCSPVTCCDRILIDGARLFGTDVHVITSDRCLRKRIKRHVGQVFGIGLDSTAETIQCRDRNTVVHRDCGGTKNAHAAAQSAPIEIIVKCEYLRPVVILPVRGCKSRICAPIAGAVVLETARGENVHVYHLLPGGSIAESSFTHTFEELWLLLQLDSHHACRGTPAAFANRTFPTLVARYAA